MFHSSIESSPLSVCEGTVHSLVIETSVTGIHKAGHFNIEFMLEKAVSRCRLFAVFP